MPEDILQSMSEARKNGRHPPGRPTEDISGRQPGRPTPSSILSFVIKAPHETMHLALVTKNYNIHATTTTTINFKLFGRSFEAVLTKL